MIFNCDKCKAICCYNPPQISNIDEFDFAKSQGVEIVAFKINKKKYAVMIAKKNDKCPFLMENDNKCSIYENRFLSCKNYKCAFYNQEINLFIDPFNFLAGLQGQNTNKNIPILLVDEKFIKKEKIKVLTKNELIEKVYATDTLSLLLLINEINDNLHK